MINGKQSRYSILQQGEDHFRPEKPEFDIEEDEEVKKWEADLIRKSTKGFRGFSDTKGTAEMAKKTRGGHITEIRAKTRNTYSKLRPRVSDGVMFYKMNPFSTRASSVTPG